MTDQIRYDLLAQAALRGVVRTVMTDVARKGLPGEHHFKITFNTTAPGVRLSERMRGQYPQTMTIVLQHQFWDLVVGESGFEVGLSFGGVAEPVAVPFDAITAFFDPAAQFGLQFESAESLAAEHTSATPQIPDKAAAPADRLPEPSKTEPAPPPRPEPDRGPSGAEVVRLDRFRKK